MFNIKNVSESLKPLLGIIFIATLAFIYFIISSFNEAVGVEVEKAGAFSARVSYEVSAHVVGYFNQLRSLDENLRDYHETENPSLNRKLQNYFTSNPEIEAVYFLSENQVVDTFLLDNHHKTGNIIYNSTWRKLGDSAYKFQFIDTSKSSVLITIPIIRDKYDEMAMVINVETLAELFYKNDDYDLTLVINNETILYSDDLEIVNQLIDHYGIDILSNYENYSRERNGFRIGDFNYINNHIVHYDEVFENLSLLTSKSFKRLSYRNIEDNIMSHLIVFILMVISVVVTIIYSTHKSKVWVETDRQFLNEIIDMDKIQITELKKELSFYSNLFIDTPEPMILVEKDSLRIINVNKKTTEMLGYAHEDLTTMTLNNVFHWENEEVIDGLLEVQIKKQSEEVFRRMVRIQELMYNDVEMLMFVILRKKMIDKVDNHLELFHEIRSPLQGAVGAVSMIEKATNHYADYTSIIKKSLNSILMMTNNVLSEGKLISANQHLVIKEVDLVKVVDEVVNTIVFQDQHYNMIAAKVKEKKNDTLVNLDSYLVKTDVMKIRQILINLMANASKYTMDGLVDLTVEVTKGIKDHIKFIISDTGSGLSKHEIDQLYDNFKTFHNSNITSTGIGLGITKRYIELLGSQLQVTSEKGIGSVFSFTLSLDPVDNINYINTSEKSILILDDDIVSCEFLKKFLRSELGCFVKTISNEVNLLSELTKHTYDCLIIDQTLNHFTGVDLVKLIKSSYNNNIQNTPVILITASNHPEAYSDVEGIYKILLKPFDNKLVIEILNSLFKTGDKDNPFHGFIDESIIDIDIFLDTFESVGNHVFIELVDKFIINSREEMNSLESLMMKKDYTSLANILHRFKGSMSYFGPKKMTHLMIALEDQLSLPEEEINLPFKEFKENYLDFIEELIVVKKNIKMYLNK